MKKLLIVVAVILFCTAFTMWENSRVFVSRYTLTSDKVESSLKIAQVSDFHSCELGEEAISAVKKEAPDIIVITGDLIDGGDVTLNTATDFVKGLSDIAPIYYVSGNHEFYSSHIDQRLLNPMGTTILF